MDKREKENKGKKKKEEAKVQKEVKGEISGMGVCTKRRKEFPKQSQGFALLLRKMGSIPSVSNRFRSISNSS